MWVYLWKESEVILFNDNYTTLSNADLISEWWQSVWVAYWLNTSSNWLCWVTFENDTASWIEFQIAEDLTWKKLYREFECNSWTFNRWGNVMCELRSWIDSSNMRKKYNASTSHHTWSSRLWSLPWYNSGQYSDIWSGILSFRDWVSADNIDMKWDKNSWNWNLYWIQYSWSPYYLWLPFTTWIYKWSWYIDFSTREYSWTWEAPDSTTATFTRDLSSESDANKNAFNTWLAWTDKYISLQSARWFWGSSYDKCFRVKAKVRYE